MQARLRLQSATYTIYIATTVKSRVPGYYAQIVISQAEAEDHLSGVSSRPNSSPGMVFESDWAVNVRRGSSDSPARSETVMHVINIL